MTTQKTDGLAKKLKRIATAFGNNTGSANTLLEAADALEEKDREIHLAAINQDELKADIKAKDREIERLKDKLETAEEALHRSQWSSDP